MSQKRVIVGTDDRGRPISEWSKSSAEDAPYGFMEPAFEATVERRQATPDELAAAVARETPAGYLRPKPAATVSQLPAVGIEVVETQQSWNGSGRHLPPAEEGTMDEPTPAPKDVIHTVFTPSPLTALSDAAAVAHQKLEAVRVAQEAWEIARAALDRAMLECLTVIGSPVPSAAAPKTLARMPAPRREGPRPPGRDATHPAAAADRAERAARVSEAVARHGGDRSAAAAELGMRLNAVTMVMKFADRRTPTEPAA